MFKDGKLIDDEKNDEGRRKLNKMKSKTFFK